MNWLQRFLPDEANRSMLPGFLAICIAVTGGIVNAIGWQLNIRWMALVGLAIAAVGIAVGLAAILLGQLRGASKLIRHVLRRK